MKESNEKNAIPIIIIALVIIYISLTISGCVDEMRNNAGRISSLFEDEYSGYDENAFNIIASTENKDLEDFIVNYAKSEGIDVNIEYSGTIDIMDKLNSGEKYDAVWTSNSIWLYMLDSSKVKTSEAKSTSINPVIFAIKKSKAEELGFVGKDIYTRDIVSAIRDGKLKFSMSNPTQTNTGATAYLGLLSTLAGNPEVLKKENLDDQVLKNDMITLFSGLARSSGSDEFLEEMFLNGSYDSVITYESSIISLNKHLEEKGEEVLYALYPVDGVSISDSPFAFINNGIETKKDEFLKIRNYILSSDGQKYLAQTGRRTWYGGINSNVDKTVFNPNWGINTTKYIVPLKFPSTEIIKAALSMYQTEFRKPVSIAFCLDYSGSMYGEGNKQLVAAMDYILNEDEAQNDLLQFTYKDKIVVIPFSSDNMEIWSTNSGSQTKDLLTNIHKLSPDGGTNIYDAAIGAIDQIEDDDINTYNKSVVLMTDGQSNMGTYRNLERRYNQLSEEIPIYSIMFGDADKTQLEDIAELTNAKVFDGRTNLLEAFKEVRGYN